MSQYTCTCGHVVSDGRYPSPGEGILFSETSLEQFLAVAGTLLADLKKAESEDKRAFWINSHLGEGYPDDATDSEVLEDLLSLEVSVLAVSTVSCESCGRFHIQGQPGVARYITYVRDPKVE